MARYVQNRAFRREFEATPEFQQGRARITAGVAKSIKEAAQPFRATGYFIRKTKARRDRVRFEDNFAHLIEYGSKNNPAYAPIRRGVKDAGLRYDDSRQPD